MPKRAAKKTPKDVNASAAAAEEQATAEEPTPDLEKNPHAVAMGKLGGQRGGKVRASRMTPAQRSEAARAAAKARWERRTS